jgi:hypothetical protein
VRKRIHTAPTKRYEMLEKLVKENVMPINSQKIDTRKG